MMRTSSISLLALTMIVFAGCDTQKSPETVANDVASAEAKASAEIAKKEDQASQDVAKAADKVDGQLSALNNVAAKEGLTIALAKAEGDRKVAIAQCGAVGGAAQKSCHDQADADYEAVKANAKATAQSEKTGQ